MDELLGHVLKQAARFAFWRPDLRCKRNVGGQADDDAEGQPITAPTAIAAPTGMRLR
jgi:hypothetical protein